MKLNTAIKNFIIIFSILGSFFTLISCSIIYPDFSIFENAISDFGKDSLTNILFLGSVFLVPIGIFLNSQNTHYREKFSNKINLYLNRLLIVSMISLILVGLLPSHLYNMAHSLFAVIFFFTYIVYMVGLTVLKWWYKKTRLITDIVMSGLILLALPLLFVGSGVALFEYYSIFIMLGWNLTKIYI